MTDLRVRDIKRSTAAALEISQHQRRAKTRPVPFSADMRYLPHMDIQTKREILQAAKRELMRHSWDTFVDVRIPWVAQSS
jgi:hypothetical protein